MEKELKGMKKKLEKDLSRIAEKDPELKEDWKARYPDVGFEGSEDEGEDRAMARAIYEERRAVEQALELKLKKVNNALKKIKSGGYGVCENCGREISKERIEAVPEAKFCRECMNIKS